MDFLHGRLVSKCRLFTDEHMGFVKAGRVITGGKSIASLLGFLKISAAVMISDECAYLTVLS